VCVRAAARGAPLFGHETVPGWARASAYPTSRRPREALERLAPMWLKTLAKAPPQ
jgi:hypothetical protein